MPINGPALGALAFGSVFLYSAIKGKSVLASAQAVIQGKSPATVKQTNPITDNTAPDTSNLNQVSTLPNAPGSTNSLIANDALRYEGSGYVWGGAPAGNPKNKGIGPHDCSSFANWVVGHDLGMAIPGFKAGTYDGSTHGPTTLSWITFGQHVSGGANAAVAGDILVWQTHMGICIGPGQMISALDPRLGTAVTSISGGAPFGEILSVRRI